MSLSIEDELWNIYTFYSLHGNPKDPSRISGSVLFRFCRDIMVLDPAMTEKPTTQAELHLIFTSETKSKGQKSKLEKTDKLDYNGFLSCLMRIAVKCYPSYVRSQDSMQQLLMDNVLPLASRRVIPDMNAEVLQPAVETLYSYYQESLMELFRFFATASDQKAKGKTMMKSTSSNVKTFDDQKDQIVAAKEKILLQNSLANQMGYSDFLRFASDFGLTNSMGLTTLDLGDIYLSVIAVKKFELSVRKLEFREFWEALVRCALIAFKDHPLITIENKVKGMFLYIWRHIQSTVQDQIAGGKANNGIGGLNTYKGGLLRGSQILNERFMSAWVKDDHCDYLVPQADPVPDKVSVLKKLIGSPRTGNETTAMDGHASSSPHVTISMKDEDDLGDHRITPANLKKLLEARPDIAGLLQTCMIDSGIKTKRNEPVSSPKQSVFEAY